MHLFPVLLVLAWFLGPIARLQADLTIVQKTEGAMNSGEMKLRIRENKARADVAAQLSMITDLTTGDTVTLNHNAKVLIRMPGTEAAKMRAVAAGLKPGAEPPKLTPAGKKEKVGEHECDVFTWRIGELEVTDWISAAYPNGLAIMAELQRFQNAGLASAAQPLMPPLDQFPGMVIKREMNLRGTKTTATLVSVDRAAIDPKSFEIPAGYKEQPAPKLPEKNEGE